MKKYFFILFFAGSCIVVNAQITNQQLIEDSIIGWEKIYSFKGKQYKPMVLESQTFSSYQQSLRDSFITWMQRTYTPIGGWGTVFERNYTTTLKKGPVPQGIGADFLIWNVAFDKTGKKLEKISETWTPVYIYTNVLMGRNDLTILCNPKQYYFTMSKQNYNSTFADPTLINIVKDYGLHDGDRFKKFMVYFDGRNVNVVLTPGNQLPIRQLTKGELLEALEEAIPTIVANEKADRSTNKFEQDRVETEFKPRWVKTIANMKEKYKTKLNELAYVTTQYGPTTSDLYSVDDDFFLEGKPQYGQGFAVYQFDKAAIEKSKQDKPLWITISWSPQKPNSGVKGYELHRAMLRYFNFEYVYDYFFNPEKVKGIAYKPSNAEEQAALIQQLKKHYAPQENKPLAASVFFADDFSSNTDGGRPNGWNDSRGRTPAQVVSLKNQSGKWVQLGHMNELSPSISLKKTLPENFTLEFDIVTDEFAVRTGGAVTVSLNTYQLTADGGIKPNDKGSTLQLDIKAGSEADYNNNNYSGGAQISINSKVSGYEGAFNNNYDLREFTNKKTKLHAAIKVKNEEVTLFINNKPVAVSKDFKQDYNNNAVCKGLPAGTLFRNLSFTNTTYNWSPDGKSNPVNVYISNVKIMKE